MQIQIYQINTDRDPEGYAFESYARLCERQPDGTADAGRYDRVYSGSVPAEDLEDVYRIFNTESPENYRGRSMSVSDIVEVKDPEGSGVQPGCFYCDTVGFREVPFDPERAEEKERDTIRVLLLEPGKVARECEIGTRLADLQKAVGGWIETVYPFAEEVCIVCNDEGKLRGMKPNRALRGEDGEVTDIICGPFLICGFAGENFSSLSREQLDRYGEQFSRPEHFYRINGEKIVSVAYDPQRCGWER